MVRIKNVYLYFDGSFQRSFLDLFSAIQKLQFWLDPIKNSEIFNPITIVIK